MTATLVSAAITAVAGLAALASGRVLLFPSLGPTAVMQAQNPEHASSRLYNVVVSHTIGLAAAFLSVALFGIAGAPSVFDVHSVSAPRVGAAALAVALAVAGEFLLKATHPPAASTTLLAALGSFHPVAKDVVSVLAGVLIVGICGEVARQWRVRAGR